MSSVFHYTDSAGLLGILSSKSVFATHYRYLNDVSEGGLIRDLILPILEDEIAEINPKLRERGLLKGFYETHGVRGNRLQAEGFYTSLVNSLDNTTPPFVLSFCRHTEDKTIKHGLLSQWRGYAGSAGFAIEFDEGELVELIKIECETFAYPWMKSRQRNIMWCGFWLPQPIVRGTVNPGFHSGGRATRHSPSRLRSV
jgi:hypothetical protein